MGLFVVVAVGGEFAIVIVGLSIPHREEPGDRETSTALLLPLHWWIETSMRVP